MRLFIYSYIRFILQVILSNYGISLNSFVAQLRYFNYHVLQHINFSAKCVTTPNVYGNILGPTPDESILAGLQTVIDLCKQIDTCKTDRSVGSSSNSSIQSTIMKVNTVIYDIVTDREQF